MKSEVPRQLMTVSHDSYRKDGYLVVADALSTNQLELLYEETVRVCRGCYGSYNRWRGPHNGQSDEEVLAQYICVHYPHKISPLLRQMFSLPVIVDQLTKVIGPNVKAIQSMLFIKAAGKPGQAWHQDESYIPTRDRSLTGAWIALDDATTENGCLWVIPGSHRPGILWPMREQDDTKFDCGFESYELPYSDADAIPVELPKGSAVILNGYLLHRSLPNRAKTGYRRALINHYMSAESLLPWRPPKEGEYMAQADTRDFEIVAGQDPYPWKGREDIQQPSVRAGGEGGCQTEFS